MENINTQIRKELIENKYKKISSEESIFKTTFTLIENTIEARLKLIKEQILKLESEIKYIALKYEYTILNTLTQIDKNKIQIIIEIESYKNKKEINTQVKELDLKTNYNTLSGLELSVNETKDKRYNFELIFEFNLKI